MKPWHLDRDPIPTWVRVAVYQRSGTCGGIGSCEDCGLSSTIELHHLSYYTADGDIIFGAETPEDLAALCRDCHQSRHTGPGGEFIADPEECAETWTHYLHIADKDD